MATIQISKSLKVVAQSKAYQRALLTSLVTGIKALAITAPLRYGGGSVTLNSSAINKQCRFRQLSTSNPPQRKAANR